MALSRLGDYDAQPHNALGSKTIQQLSVYSNQQELLGKVVDGLLDETGNFHFLVVEINPEITQKQVLLPLNNAQIDLQQKRVYLVGMSLRQFVDLPVYNSQYLMAPHSTYAGSDLPIVLEEQPLEMSAPLEAPTLVEVLEPQVATSILDTADVESSRTVVEPDLPEVSPSSTPMSLASPTPDPSALPEHPSISFEIQQEFNRAEEENPAILASADPTDVQRVQLLEERLVADCKRRKVGEVIVRKEVETRMIQVPLRREKLIVEQVSPKYRRLAVVHLPPASEAVELVDDLAVDQSGTKIVREFASLEAAQQFLQSVAGRTNLNCRKVQVSMVMDNLT